MPDVRRLWQTEQLFSDHYLKAGLGQNEWWPSDDETNPVWTFCRDLYNRRFLALAKNNEAFTRQELIDRVLEKLGFAWTDNLSLPDQDAEPDYILFTSQAEKESVLDKDTASRYRAAAALLEAKKLHHSLSQVSKHQQRYPHQQIRDYLQDARVLAWGILTNGNEWRLYCRDARRQDFFAINFEAAIQSLENFKVFLALFSPAAFQRDAQGKCRLDFIREQSLSTQSQLEEDLRQRVFTILTDLANGFASRLENQIPDTDEGRKALYENCLIYLYRLLFLLYAEGRGLLPVEPRSRRYYKELSLERLKPDLKNFAAYDSQTRTRLGEDITELFRLVNGTDEAKNKEYSVARYNGGLFDPAQHPLVENWRIADADLAGVLRGLMFDPPPEPNKPTLPIQTVDFGDLRVQQLGSIYEGLLEHHFTRTATGRLELQTDKAERKATGTYYTPDYIVKYIVAQTLTPLLDEIERGEAIRAARQAKRQDNSFADAVLTLNVCDPAMGSGHFLVEATTFLADHIAAHPTTRRLHDKSKDEEELAYWRRRVVEACIYGVDLNPLAVELAKLSLWLTCIAIDQPLNFLDHHLRCGNSLIGARLDQLGSLPQKRGQADTKQMRFTFGPDFKRAVAETIQQIQIIEGEASRDVVSVKTKEKRWEIEILPRLAPYKRVADLWTNTFFDGPLSEEEYLAAAKSILVEAEAAADSLRESAGRRYLKELDKPYFHWELEFPDVFFNTDGSPKTTPGFDAVIGNPPYGPVADAHVKILLQRLFTATLYQPDLYVAFMERAHVLTRRHGLEGSIVPTTFLTMHYFSGIRRYLLDGCRILRLVHFRYPVSTDPPVESAVYICQAEPDAERRRLNIVTGHVIGTLAEFLNRGFALREIGQAGFEENPGHDFNLSLGGKEAAIVTRMRNGDVVLLGSIADMTVGVKPYQTGKGKPKQTREVVEKRVFDASYRKDRTYRVYLMGRDIGRYVVDPLEERWISYGDWLAEPRPDAPFSDSARIIVRQTGDSIIAAADDKQRLTLNNIHNLRLRPDAPAMAYMLAVLNSRLTTFFHQQVVPEADRVFAEVKIVDLQQIPIRRIKFVTPKSKRAGLAAKAKKLYESAVAAENGATLLAFVEEQLRAQPERSDVVHDLLAFLAGRMMDLNQRQRAVARQFLTDLRDFHGIEARALNPKTKLDEFWKLDTAEVFVHLGKNRKALAAARVDLSETAENKIRSRFEKSKATILPLEAQIAFTDRLIDQIVYRLYGLTADEIELVEEGSRR